MVEIGVNKTLFMVELELGDRAILFKVMSFDSDFLRCSGSSTRTSVLSEFSIRKLLVIHAFLSLRHASSLTNYLF